MREVGVVVFVSGFCRWRVILAALLSLGAVPLGAETAGGGGAAGSGGFWQAMLGNAVGLTILFVLLTAIVGAIVRTRKRDRVLRDFDRYFVVAVFADGRRVWGTARVFPNGLEIVYESPVVDGSGHVETSFFLHAGEFGALRALLRPKRRLTAAMQRRRRRDILRYIRPTLYRRFLRFLVIQLSILRDAVMQVFTLIVGQARMIARPDTRVGSVLQTQDRQIGEMGRTVIGAVQLAYDPILESLFGQGCVAETKEGDGWREVPGFLKEYSADWLLLLRGAWPVERTVTLKAGETEAGVEDFAVLVRRGAHHAVVVNEDRTNVELVSLEVGEARHDLGGVEVLPGGMHPLEVVLGGEEVAVLTVRCLEGGDVILPRVSTVMRHRLVRESLSLLENVGLRR